MSLSTDQTGSTGGTFSSQFTFDANKGTIKLQNGRTFAIEVTESDKTKQVGADSPELLVLVKEILEHVSKEQQFTFTDLSKTSITYQGVKTDQLDRSTDIKLYTDQTYTEKYQQISQVAHETLLKVSVPQRGSVLQRAGNERIGSDATTPGAIRRDESIRERTATVIDTSDQDVSIRESQLHVIENTGEGSAEDEQISISVSATAAKLERSTQVRFNEVSNINIDSNTQGVAKKEPSKTKQLWDQFVNFLSTTFGSLTKRSLPEPIAARTAAEILELTDPENDDEADIVDRESNVVFSNIPLKVKSAQSEETGRITYEYQNLTIVELERIVTETAKVDGKVKIRADKDMLQHGMLILRAGHRASKPGKKSAKRIGTGKKSLSAMHVMIDAFQHHQKRLKLDFAKKMSEIQV